MRLVRWSILIPLVAFLCIVRAPATSAQTPQLIQIASGLASPVLVTHAGDGSGRLFIVEQPGRIRVFQDGVLLGTPFLDISGIVLTGGEQGLLGLAFHPDYESNGLFFVYYTDRNGNNSIARYSASPPSSNAASAAGAVILNIPHPNFTNHNGGHIAFGPDGLLYVATGDGGGSGDPNNNGQSLTTLLGKILRINVNAATYSIPAGNPFADGGGSNRDEIWHRGLRNPWRFSFDRGTGEMFIGDVGQGSWEEIDYAGGGVGGLNYGWRRMEGAHCFNPSTGCNTGGLTLPIIEYANGGEQCAVTGGYRYRGNGASMQGTYFFGDYCSGRIWTANVVSGSWPYTELMDTALNISSFGEDESGEIYVVNHGGTIHKFLIDVPCPGREPDNGGFMAYAPSFSGGVFAAAGNVTGDSVAEIVTGADRGGPHVRVFNAGGTVLSEFMAYAPDFGGGARVGTADVDGNGTDEVITAPGAGGGPHVRVVDGSGASIAAWMAYSTEFTGGVYVAGADVNGDGRDEVITSPGPGGGPHVRIWSVAAGSARELSGFMAYSPSFAGGVRVAGGQLNATPQDEVVTAPGPGGGPHIKLFDVSSAISVEQGGFMSYSATFSGGVFLATGDYIAGGLEEVITAPDAGGGPHVRIFAVPGFGEAAGFMAYDCRFAGGVRLAAGNVNAGLSGDEIVTVPGPGGGPHARIWD